MPHFKKTYNLKIISIVIGVSFFFTSSLYAMPFSEDTIALRVPVGQKDTSRRLITGGGRVGTQLSAADKVSHKDSLRGSHALYKSTSIIWSYSKLC